MASAGKIRKGSVYFDVRGDLIGVQLDRCRYSKRC